jgi:hypothetical protein
VVKRSSLDSLTQKYECYQDFSQNPDIAFPLGYLAPSPPSFCDSITVSTDRQVFFNDFFIFSALVFTLNTNILFAQIQDSRPKDFSGQREQMPYNHLQIG